MPWSRQWKSRVGRDALQGRPASQTAVDPRAEWDAEQEDRQDEADVEDERFDAPEAAGLDAIIRGMGSDLDDVGLLEASTPLYDGLLATIRMRTAPSSAGR